MMENDGLPDTIPTQILQQRKTMQGNVVKMLDLLVCLLLLVIMNSHEFLAHKPWAEMTACTERLRRSPSAAYCRSQKVR